MSSNGPYSGLRVFDLSHVIAGPLCTHLLADLGADVVRIEPRSGDLMRQLPVAFDGDISSAFAQYNCGKRSASVDLKTPEGREVALRLVDWADIVVENFSPGTLDRLGLSYDVMAARNERVILCSLSTFGAVGSWTRGSRPRVRIRPSAPELAVCAGARGPAGGWPSRFRV